MQHKNPSFTAFVVPDIPLIQPGDDLPQIIYNAFIRADLRLQSGDVLVISSKIISKSEGRFVRLTDVHPGEEARQRAKATGKDPRIVELVLQESQAVSRQARGVLVTAHRLGFVSANSGIDQSNIENGDAQVLLLPLDPDQSALTLKQSLGTLTDTSLAVVISDTHGRPFRMGNVGVALGVAGVVALHDLRGESDLYGRELRVSTQGYADLLASAAHLLCGEAGEGYPVTVLRGLNLPSGDGKASDLYRPPAHDLYR